MAVNNKRVPKKRKKRREAEEEVVIRIGETPVDEEIVIKEEPVKELEEEEEIVLKEEPEEEFEGEYEEVVELEEEPLEDFDIEDEEEYEEVPEEVEPEEEEDDVVVISLGPAPKEKKAAIKEVLIEEPEEEGEEVEEEGPEEAEVIEEEGKPKKEEEGISKRKKLAAVIIVIVIIISSIGIYFLFILNKNPSAKLQLYPETAPAGFIITIDGSNSSDDKGIITYFWSFGDGDTYLETKSENDGRFNGKTTHSFDEPGDYKVDMIVTDEEGERDNADVQITITDLEVTIPAEMIGDSITYDVNGTVEVTDPDGLWTGEESGGTITLEEIFMEYEGEMTSETIGISDAKDGFKESHSTLQKFTSQELELDGTVSGTLEISGATTSMTLPFEGGELDVTDYSYVDLNTNKTIFSDITSDFFISAGDTDISSHDDLRTYGNLRMESSALRIEDLEEDGIFEVGDSQTKWIGDIGYSWTAWGVTNIKGYPSIEIRIDIDDTTKENNNINDFEMKLWITNDVPLPVKTYIYTRMITDGTVTTIEYNNEVQNNGFTRGTTDIPWGTCPTPSPNGHYHSRNPGFEFVNWDIDDDIPDMGSGSSSVKIPPEDAVGFAKGSAGLISFIIDNPGAYVIDGYYNETDEIPRWNLTFGQEGEETAYYVVVKGDGSIMDEAQISVSEVRNSSLDIDEVLSFSAGELVFESDDEVDSRVFDDNGDIMFYNDVNYGARADIVYLTISFPISLTLERTEYGYYLYTSGEEGSFYAGIDAINGQFIYVWDHEGEDILSVLLGV